MTKENKLSYIDIGEGHPLLLIHGFCGSKEYWKNLIPHLKIERRVIVVDLPGHGESPMNRLDFSIEDLAHEIYLLSEQLSLPKFDLFGHSLGGYVTLAFAEAYPEKLAGFSLVHSTAYPDDSRGKEGRLQAIKKIKEEGIIPFVDELVPKLFADPSDEGIVTAKEIGYKTDPKGAIAALQAMKNRPDRNAVIEQAAIPVLLIAGENDKIVPVEKAFAVKTAQTQEKILDGCGHMGMLESPAKLAKVILKFTESR